MSKHSIAKELIETATSKAVASKLDRNEVIEALLTSCVEDMKKERGAPFTKDYVQYELDCVGSGGVFEIQKR